VSAASAPIAGVPRHGRRIFAIWLVCTAVAVPLIVLVLGPHLPPGRMTSEASAQTDTNVVMTALVAPIVLLLWIYFAYSLVVFRARGAAIEDGRPIFGHMPSQTVWVVATTLIVIGLAAYGSYTLIGSSDGAGGGQGPNPVALPSDPPGDPTLQVQVIGQQWNWTYRFLAYGGVETAHLELPVSTPIELHVTSLDVTHSFWAYELGVKADAVPGVDNIVFVHARHTGSFSIRCAELCGLWHGHMFQTGEVVGRDQFAAWIKQQQAAGQPNHRYLPPYGRTYFPEPTRRAG
jgi:cytochrome c oxidase subunit II